MNMLSSSKWCCFFKGKQRNFYDFTKKFSEGPGTTWQIRRANFDHLLAQQAAEHGDSVRYGHEVLRGRCCIRNSEF